MEKKFHYVYITTNLITKKQYVGDRSCNCNPKDDKYLGSGRPYFQRALKEYGKENFLKIIIDDSFKNREEAFNAQEKYINEYNTLVPNGYNISPKGGHNVKECWSEESKEKCRITQRGKTGYYKNKFLSEEHKQHISESMKREKQGPRSIKHRQHISESTKGKKKSPLSMEHKQKLSQLNKGHNRQTGEKNSQYGIKWVYNLNSMEIKAIKKDKFNEYLNLGWIPGRKIKDIAVK